MIDEKKLKKEKKEIHTPQIKTTLICDLIDADYYERMKKWFFFNFHSIFKSMKRNAMSKGTE